MDEPFQRNAEMSTWTRTAQIELNASYIHKQYQTIMKRLHQEIEHLKSANRDLQFQLILLHQANQSMYRQENTNYTKKTNEKNAYQTGILNNEDNHRDQFYKNDTYRETHQNKENNTYHRTNQNYENDTYHRVKKRNSLQQYETFETRDTYQQTNEDNDKYYETKNKSHGTDKEEDIFGCLVNRYELDYESKWCNLKLKCEQCQNYTPLTIDKLDQDRIKHLLNDGLSSTQKDNKENLTVNTSPSEISDQHTSTPHNIRLTNHFQSDKIHDNPTHNTNQVYEANLLPNSMNQNPANQMNPLLKIPLNHQFTINQIENPNLITGPFPLNRSPIVHKTYVLSIEDRDPTSSNRKIQKTIVWSKRQIETGLENEETRSETPCTLPPIQHWQESGCTSAVKKIQTSTTPTLPEIVSKKF